MIESVWFYDPSICFIILRISQAKAGGEPTIYHPTNYFFRRSTNWALEDSWAFIVLKVPLSALDNKSAVSHPEHPSLLSIGSKYNVRQGRCDLYCKSRKVHEQFKIVYFACDTISEIKYFANFVTNRPNIIIQCNYNGFIVIIIETKWYIWFIIHLMKLAKAYMASIPNLKMRKKWFELARKYYWITDTILYLLETINSRMYHLLICWLIIIVILKFLNKCYLCK